MRYFVRGPDGRLYGPADVETLRAWARAGRLPRHATLIAEDTQAEARADAVLGEPQTWPPPAAGTRRCPNCGQAVPAASAYCPHCGAGPSVSPTPGIGLPRGCVIFLVVIAVIVGALLLGLLALCSGAFTPH